jgi:DNA-binding NtrC family response regulator
MAMSDSFTSVWPPLARECGLELVPVDDLVAWSESAHPIKVLAAGGEEARLPALLGRVGSLSQQQVAAVGADPSHRIAVATLRAGASEYFALPDDLDLLRSWLRAEVERLAAQRQGRAFAAREWTKYRFEGMIGTSRSLRKALELAARVIPHAHVSVLITGETGTGKELVARAIHYNGPRRDAPFVDVNCAAIPDPLLESELFGHERGAFTDATTAKPGLFEVAHRGTLFLDEIGHLTPTLQGKLLRVLEQRTIRRVGGTASIAVDVRVIAATHADLAEASARGDFREDLFYRLNVVPIELPALRSREGDVVLLAEHFLSRFAEEYGLARPRLTPAATERLRQHGWTGNVRELRNLMERTILLHPGPAIDEGDLAFRAGFGSGTGSGAPLPFPATMREIIWAAARETLRSCQGNKSAAARRLVISRTRLQRLLDGRNLDSHLEETDE